MNFLHSTMLFGVMLTNMTPAHTYDANNPTDFIAWQEAQAEKLRKHNGGDLTDFNTGILKFIRTHAQEIGKELEHLIDHTDPHIRALHYYEFEKAFKSCSQFLATKPFAERQTLAQMLAKKETGLVVLDMVAYLKAFKQLVGQQIDPATYPILAQGLQQLAIIEEIAFEFVTLHQQQQDTVIIPAIDAEAMDKVLLALPVLKRVFDAEVQYLQSEKATQLTKQLIRAWAAYMQEDEFLETLQHNAKCRSINDLKPVQLPETLERFAIAYAAFREGFFEAIESELVYPVIGFDAVQYADIDPAGYEADDEDIDWDLPTDTSKHDNDDDCDDCMEYDFNEFYNKKR